MAQAAAVALPTSLSIDERDRRYRQLRADLRERGVNAALVVGSNLFYLTNGLSGERVGLLPTADEPPTVVLNGRHLADVSASVLLEAQDWIQDIRGGNDLTPLIDRIRELRLEHGTLGLGNRDLPLGAYQQLQRAFPDARLVDVAGSVNPKCTVPETLIVLEAKSGAFRVTGVPPVGIDTGLKVFPPSVLTLVKSTTRSRTVASVPPSTRMFGLVTPKVKSVIPTSDTDAAFALTP